MNEELYGLSDGKRRNREAGRYTKTVQESNSIKIQMAEVWRDGLGHNFNLRNKALLFQQRPVL